MVDPVTDEMLAQFVVDSHCKSQPKGSNFDDRSVNNSQDENQASAGETDPEVLILISCYHLSHSNIILICNSISFSADNTPRDAKEIPNIC